MLQQFGQTSASVAETPWLAAVKFELHHGLGVSCQGRRKCKVNRLWTRYKSDNQLGGWGSRENLQESYEV